MGRLDEGDGRLDRVRRLVTSLRYSRPQQLADRLRLTFQRRLAQLGARVLPIGAKLSRGPLPALRADLAPPLFAPRTSLVDREGERPFARVLEQSVPLSPPIDWRWPRDRPGTRLDRLTLHYHEWAEGLGDADLRLAILDWIESNPPYGRRYWCDAWSSYALSIRCVVWLQQIAARHGRLDREFVGSTARSIVAQLRFLTGNLELDIGGNHLIRNIKALLWGARAFDGPEAAAWGALGAAHLERELASQVLADGVHFERSPAYHAQVFCDLLECLHVLPQGALLDRLRAALDGMAQALAELTHPDGDVSLFGDGGLHMAYEPAAALAAHRRLGGAPVEPRAAAALSDAGYFTARAGADLVVVDCGRLGPDELPAHAHGDALAFEWTLSGRRVIVDAGVFEYQGPLRAWSRATRSHNTVTLDDGDQAEFWSEFRMARRPNVTVEAYEADGLGFRLRGRHDGYAHLAGAPIHERRFQVRPDRIEIEDTVAGGSGQSVRARLLLHPDVTVTEADRGVLLASGAARARLSTSSPIAVVAAHYAPDFGVRRETRQIVLDYGVAPCGGSFTLERLP